VTTADALILDFGGVLSQAHDTARFRDLLARIGLTLEEFVRRYWRHRPAYDLGLPAREYWSRVLDGVVPPDNELIAELIAVDVESWTHYREPVWSIAAEFRARGGKTAMLSNGIPEIVRAIRAQRSLASYFDSVIISFEVGLVKPDPAIYQLCLDRLQVQPSQALFVDDLATNIEAADRLGIATLLFAGDSSIVDLRARLGL